MVSLTNCIVLGLVKSYQFLQIDVPSFSPLKWKCNL